MNSAVRNRNTPKRKDQDTVNVRYPEGVTRITTDPYNPYGYIDPASGAEIDARTGRRAWVYVSSPDSTTVDDPKMKGMYRRYNTMPVAKEAVVREIGSIPLPSSGGVPVGGQAASPGATGTVGDLQSRSKAAATVMSQGSMSQPTPTGPGATQALPFVMTPTSAVDVGVGQGQVVMPMLPQTSIVPGMSRQQWDSITAAPTKYVPEVVRPSAPMTMPMPRSMQPMPIPTMPVQQDQSPWYENLIRSIFG